MYKIELSVDSPEKLVSIIENLGKCEFTLSADIYSLPKKNMEWSEDCYPDIVLLSDISRFLKYGGKDSL